MSKILDRVADAGGILFVLLTGVGYIALVGPSMPESLESPTAVVDHLQAHPPTAAFWAGVWMEGAGLAALVLLAARLAARLRATDPSAWTPAAVVGLAVAGFTVKIGSFAAGIAALDVDRYDAGTVTALLGLNDASFDVAWAVDGAFALLIGLAALTGTAMPRWLAGFAVVAGLAVLVGLAGGSLFDALQPVFLLWLLVTSGWLLARGNRTVPSAPEPALAA
ncbi:DUF4386 family protein [Blastococcus sp. CT_GayMR16]|uniref:DUF4386 family protein n=1 Tax=Blastococcus sp. CT_GayMR16 TaxID=2559607 RepID=UPI0010748795|nr:DUF4386 family protein [Blastococcus sp. CT_GayMR16]TFV89847.1 DUF4386 family protein [Blastococcus sp. CT_GayMR16]